MANLNRDRGIRAEREMAIALQTAAGRVDDPKLEPMVTVTGRVGQLTSLGFDCLVGNGPVALVAEMKRRKSFLSADASRALLQIDRISHDWDRTPVLAFRLANDIQTFHEGRKGAKPRVRRDWAVVPLTFLEELLAARRFLAEDNIDVMGRSGEELFQERWSEEQETAEQARKKTPQEVEIETTD